jgi:hypothetical protein
MRTKPPARLSPRDVPLAREIRDLALAKLDQKPGYIATLVNGVAERQRYWRDRTLEIHLSRHETTAGATEKLDITDGAKLFSASWTTTPEDMNVLVFKRGAWIKDFLNHR